MNLKRIMAFLLAIALIGQTNLANAWICSHEKFFNECPTKDPRYQMFISDFKLRRQGELVPWSTVTCTEPVSSMDISNYTDELILLQALRAIFYMDWGKTNHLPWTPKPLYYWLKDKVGGFHISTTATSDHWDGAIFPMDPAAYFTIRAKSEDERRYHQKWADGPVGMATFISLIMHERRHGDGPAYDHVGCCPSSGVGACDQTYNEANLGPHGIQYWLEKNWVSGTNYLRTGYGCLAKDARTTAIRRMRDDANSKVGTSSFCANTPPLLNDTNNPPVGCDCDVNGASVGDPHLKTLNGLLYDFQAAGDFLLTTSGPSFIVQVRHQRAPNQPNVSLNTAVAMQMGQTRVAVFVDPTRVLVDGVQVALADGQTLSLPDNVEVSRNANVYLIKHGTDETVRVLATDKERFSVHFLDVSVSLNYSTNRTMRGLLGNGNGDVRDDIATRDGKVLRQPVSFKDFYHRFGASMHIKPDESLFGDDPRKGIFAPPKKPYTVRNLAPKDYRAARSVCVKAGVTPKPLLDACTLDVAVLRNPAVAKLFTEVAVPVAFMEVGTGIRMMPSANTRRTIRNTSR